MELKQEEISYIGTSLEGSDLQRIASSESSYFDYTTYNFKVKKGWMRDIWNSPYIIEGYVADEEIVNRGTLFVTYVSDEALFIFSNSIFRNYHAENAIRELGEYLYIFWEDNNLRIRAKNPCHLIEFYFTPHNTGVFIDIISRK